LERCMAELLSDFSIQGGGPAQVGRRYRSWVHQ
jgi:hypothetical protein